MGDLDLGSWGEVAEDCSALRLLLVDVSTHGH